MVKKIKSHGSQSVPQNVIIDSKLSVEVEKHEKHEKHEKGENSQYDKIFDIDSDDEEMPVKKKEESVTPIVNIPKETISRLLKDIKDMVSSSLEKEYGIYYKHSEINILKAYVMIVGPEDSLYFGGYYFFSIDFPLNYPYEPPLFTFLVLMPTIPTIVDY